MIRRDPNKDEMLASALLRIAELEGNPIPREHAQLMTAHQINSLWQFDHYPKRYVDGGTTHPDNLRPLSIMEHRIKTSKIDVPQIRKADRVVRRSQASANRMLAKAGYAVAAPIERPKRKIESRGFDKTKTRGFDGKVRARGRS
jgi:hypothetical protein